MTEESSAAVKENKAKKFFEKAKWGRSRSSSKQNTQDEVLAQQTEDKLNVGFNEDVADFLKPSTSKFKPAPPKIDLAAAQRYPGATEVRGGASSPGTALPSSMKGKQPGKRGRILTVAFVKGEPTVIGVGGDEAEAPAVEVSVRLFGHPRKLSVGQTAAAATNSGGGVQNAQGQADLHRSKTHKPSLSGSNPDAFQPKAMLRSQTSPEISPPMPGEPWGSMQPTLPRLPPLAPFENTAQYPRPMEQGPVSPPLETVLPTSGEDTSSFRPGLIKRTQTGYHNIGLHEDDEGSVRNTRDLTEYDSPDEYDSGPRLSVTDPDNNKTANRRSFSVELQQKMRQEEGKAFRASMVMQDEERPLSDATSATDDSVHMATVQTMQRKHAPQPSVDSTFPAAHQQPRPSIASNVSFSNMDASWQQRPSVSSTGGSFSGPSGEPRPMSSGNQIVAPQARRGEMSLHPPPASREVSYTQGLAANGQHVTPQPSPAPMPRGSPQMSRSPPNMPPMMASPTPSYNEPLSSPRNIPTQEPTSYISPIPNQGLAIYQAQGHSRNRSQDTTYTLNQQATQQTSPDRQTQDYGMQSTPPKRSRADSPGARETAMADFGERVTHMAGVFRLNAEFRGPITSYTPMQWLRASIWWFLRGRAGLEALIRQQRQQEGGQASSRNEAPLSQAHVDLGKTWWILTDVMPQHPDMRFYGDTDMSTQAVEARNAGDIAMVAVFETYDHILGSLKKLLASMARNRSMPPHQSLIQGQDQSIWVEYPAFAPEVGSVLSGGPAKPLLLDGKTKTSSSPLSVMPTADTGNDFCYNRMFVTVSLTTEDPNTDRVQLPCVMSVMRPRNEWRLKVTISSQSELMSVCIQGDRKQGVTWDDVQWKSKQSGMYVQLPRGFALNVDLNEPDYRQLRNIHSFTRLVENSLLPEEGEKVVYEAKLLDFHYTNAANPNAFPNGDCPFGSRVKVFAKSVLLDAASARREMHRGYRVLVVTSPKNRTLSTVSHIFGEQQPLAFEFRGDPSGQIPPSMMIRTRDKKQQSTMLFAFEDSKDRGNLFSVLNSMKLGENEVAHSQVGLKSISVQPLDQSSGSSNSLLGQDALSQLQWQDIKVLNVDPDLGSSEYPRTVLSDNLRTVARHAAGCFTDHVNLGPGELQLRLPCDGTPSLTLLRPPQVDLSLSIDTSRSSPQVPDALAILLSTMTNQSTLRTYTFPSTKDLQAFQYSITGYYVKFDGLATTFSIARRRMVVPIYKKWEAQNVRIQLVQRESVVQLVAFFEGFAHAEAMNFQLKSTDVFETKDDKGKFSVKLVDAKFPLPPEDGEGEDGGLERVKRRFVCLDLMEYPGEHDDVTVSFESATDRNRFAEALPAATQVQRGLTLKRKI